MRWPRWLGALRPRGLVAVLLPALLLTVLGAYVHWARPLYNWDLLGYVGASLRSGGASAEEVHRRAFSLVREKVSAEKFTLMTDGNSYRRTVASDPTAFDQQLPYYTSKPAYVLLMRLGTAAGLHPVEASVVLSRIAYLILGMSLWWWLRTMVGPGLAFGAAVLAMALPVVLNLARLSTPDGLSVLVSLNALVLLVERQRLALGCGMLLLALTVRLDNIVWMPLVAAYLAVSQPRRWGYIAAWLGASALLYVAIVQWSGFYGWRHLLYTNFVERLAYPADTPQALIPWSRYARVLARALHPAHLPHNLALFALLGGLTLWGRIRAFGLRDRWAQLTLGCLAFMGVHFVLYPGEDRFLVAAYLVVLLALVRTAHETATATRLSRGPAGFP